MVETAEHLFITYPAAATLWQCLGINLDQVVLSSPWAATYPAHLPSSVWPDVLLILLWRLWNARNNCIFRSEDHTIHQTLWASIRDIDLWSNRYTKTRVDM